MPQVCSLALTSLLPALSDQFASDHLPARLWAQQLHLAHDGQVVTDSWPQLVKEETQPLDHGSAHLLIRATLLLMCLRRGRGNKTHGSEMTRRTPSTVHTFSVLFITTPPRPWFHLSAPPRPWFHLSAPCLLQLTAVYCYFSVTVITASYYWTVYYH